jgi:predicted peroxiredoxin
MTTKAKIAMFAVIVGMAVLLGSVYAPSAASEHEKTTLFVNLTTDDSWSAHMAFSYAEKVMSAGYPVVLFLNVRAVRLADKAMPQEQDPASGKTAAESLMALMKDGATVYVCPSCTERAGMTKERWIAGVKPGSMETISVHMAENTKVMSY